MTDGVRKLFEKAEIIPKRPPPYGSLFLYDKPPNKRPDYAFETKYKHPPKFGKYYSKILLQEEEARLYKTELLENEAFDRAKVRAERKLMETTDIEPNDSDAESRLESFSEISERLKSHLEDMGDIAKGSDYKTAMYLRKLNLLAKKGLNFLIL